jgi:hypothetical protein
MDQGGATPSLTVRQSRTAADNWQIYYVNM